MGKVLVKSIQPSKVLVKAGPQVMFSGSGEPSLMFGGGGGGGGGLPRTRTSQALRYLGGIGGAALGATGPHQSLYSLLSGMQGGAVMGGGIGDWAGGVTRHLPGGRSRLEGRRLREGQRADYDKQLAERKHTYDSEGKPLDVGTRRERIARRMPGGRAKQVRVMGDWHKEAQKEAAKEKLKAKYGQFYDDDKFNEFSNLTPAQQAEKLAFARQARNQRIRGQLSEETVSPFEQAVRNLQSQSGLDIRPDVAGRAAAIPLVTQNILTGQALDKPEGNLPVTNPDIRNVPDYMKDHVQPSQWEDKANEWSKEVGADSEVDRLREAMNAAGIPTNDNPPVAVQ